MKIEAFSQEIDFALQVIRCVIPLTREMQKGIERQSLTKGDKSPVTVADFTVQAIIAKILKETFPQDALMGEESSDMLKADGEGKATLEKVTHFVRRIFPEATPEKVCAWIDHGKGNTKGRFWTLDPIDGTRGFIRGEHYATAFALIVKGEIQFGAIGCPHVNVKGDSDFGGSGSLAIAVRGEGSWITALNGDTDFKPIHVSKTSLSKEALILGSVEPSHTDQDLVRRVRERLDIQKSPILMDSLAKYVSLACGRGDFFLYPTPQGRPNYRMKIWDVAPGAILVEEAGGKITDFLGQTLEFSYGDTMPARNPGLVISNGKLHPSILPALNPIA